MTGHSINAGENQEFLSTMHTMIDDLDTISSNIDENTYLRLVNGLQRLYNIHNSGAQSTTSTTTAQATTTTTNTNSNNSNNRESWDQMQPETLRMNSVAQNITGALVRHYERVNDISNNPIISNIHVNSDVYPLISNDHVNVDAYPVTNNNNENIQSRIQSLNEESNRIGYSTRTRLALYNNVFNA